VIELKVIGVGAWGERFGSWEELQNGLINGLWAESPRLNPEAIPGRERRRAPQSVKLAVEVMSQACAMAGIDGSEPSVVYASAMGDMNITDQLCRTLADRPELVSPTQFHHSVHNAPIGYWSIATGSHAAGNAVACHDDSASLGLLEAAVQCVEEGLPVISVSLETAAPPALFDARPSSHALALALLLAPKAFDSATLATISLDLTEEPCQLPDSPDLLPLDYDGNPTAVLLPLFQALAQFSLQTDFAPRFLRLPLAGYNSLTIELVPRGA